MNTSAHELAASDFAFGAAAILIGGVVITAALIWAVLLGIKTRRREPRRPRPEEQPKLPPTGAVHEVYEQREPDEVRPAPDGRRLGPHDLTSGGTRRDDQDRPRWSA
ncbi:DUF6479 family protein [Streptomyces sp. NPDC006610]|jgi:hypothetical protein|uniref:DUF6479 family protein n=1 Tax=Streptomyces sp. NPDC006610 TaxID=3154584 RepID=UPI0033AD1763